jgi:hypothetical protein
MEALEALLEASHLVFLELGQLFQVQDEQHLDIFIYMLVDQHALRSAELREQIIDGWCIKDELETLKSGQFPLPKIGNIKI